jgi:hypothetical protein
LISFPAGKGEARWQSTERLFLGIDHTALRCPPSMPACPSTATDSAWTCWTEGRTGPRAGTVQRRGGGPGPVYLAQRRCRPGRAVPRLLDAGDRAA